MCTPGPIRPAQRRRATCRATAISASDQSVDADRRAGGMARSAMMGSVGEGGRFEAALFDFFGTLVEYQPERSRLAYPETHRLLQSWGHELSYSAFVSHWDSASTVLESQTAETFEEFTMLDAAQGFAASCNLDLPEQRCDELATSFVAEWQQHVCPIPGVSDLIDRLSESLRLGIVSNTHDADMVPSMLQSMGVAEQFDVVVLSVEHGYRKPHQSIYEAALDQLAIRPENVAIVGDSYDADFVGPRRAGMTPFLIDPHDRRGVCASARLVTVLEAETRLL